ncbi:PucR family transcriptional regulator [Mycolicibacter longobardus]|uniref:PucR family transcriptional regulator n=1 Tax=Mycolicibacter longobardus TaxID=1108812 RepID=A0A1X1YTE4_9MYCO|nr:helix-turn-helix domain-containing protein [Mycolicibacter longobardus]MCV7385753.1 helix-turn-helix domain-containing protein [Mycolicibacter longobardus]ORW14300.1 PucR family transcriptional regulator [Mycolicibacter longobardus]
MGDSARDRAAVADAAATIVGRLYDRLDDITRDIQQLVVTEMSELGGDAQLLQLLRDTAATSVESFFSSIRHGIPVRNLEPPTPALEYARRLAQRDVSVNALTRAYRLGHRATLRMVINEIRAANRDPELSLAVYDLMEDVSFEYIDQISQQVVASYQDERDRWVANRNNLRVLQVRELLTGGDVDVDAVTTALRYPLRRHHLAVVVWYPESFERADPLSMERFVQKLGESVDARNNSLFVPVDRVTGWGWIPLPAKSAPTAPARLRAFVENATGCPCVTAGNPLPDIEGFRRSHRQARDAWTVVSAAGTVDRRVTIADDAGLAVAALAGRDVDAVIAYVGEVLGPLASATDGDERLRETLRIFLGAGSSYTAAAEELHLHHNSVKYRVQRAVERRGRPIAGDRLEVEVALLLCEWLGAAVLS